MPGIKAGARRPMIPDSNTDVRLPTPPSSTDQSAGRMHRW